MSLQPPSLRQLRSRLVDRTSLLSSCSLVNARTQTEGKDIFVVTKLTASCFDPELDTWSRYHCHTLNQPLESAHRYRTLRSLSRVSCGKIHDGDTRGLSEADHHALDPAWTRFVAVTEPQNLRSDVAATVWVLVPVAEFRPQDRMSLPRDNTKNQSQELRSQDIIAQPK